MMTTFCCLNEYASARISHDLSGPWLVQRQKSICIFFCLILGLVCMSVEKSTLRSHNTNEHGK